MAYINRNHTMQVYVYYISQYILTFVWLCNQTMVLIKKLNAKSHPKIN